MSFVKSKEVLTHANVLSNRLFNLLLFRLDEIASLSDSVVDEFSYLFNVAGVIVFLGQEIEIKGSLDLCFIPVQFSDVILHASNLHIETDAGDVSCKVSIVEALSDNSKLTESSSRDSKLFGVLGVGDGCSVNYRS